MKIMGKKFDLKLKFREVIKEQQQKILRGLCASASAALNITISSFTSVHLFFFVQLNSCFSYTLSDEWHCPSGQTILMLLE